uniref:RING-type domain-containing protein n=1 Tax=Hanusia phi TaxID=3032 RepID=A0A7S0EXH8_9CRYP
MGASIAGQLATCGKQVGLYDRTEFDMNKGMEILRADMKAYVERGLLAENDKEAAIARIRLMGSYDEVVRSKVVIECIYENVEEKRKLFHALIDAAHKARVSPVLASNSINFSIKNIVPNRDEISIVTCGMRFLYPVWFIPPVEISSEEEERPAALVPLWGMCEEAGLKPFYVSTKTFGGFSRMKLDQSDVDEYHGKRKASLASSLGASQGTGGPAPARGGERECNICLEPRHVFMILAPCGHKGICEQCANKIRGGTGKCPTCRCEIERMLVEDSYEH